MGRNGSGVYSLPSGSTVTNGDTSDATDLNTPLSDLETDANTARPVVAGGTGASTAKAARTNLLFAKGADVASATSLSLGATGNYFDVTGTTTITSIATWNVGDIAYLHFDGALTLTHHATNLILPGGANITTAAGDEAAFIEYASGTWRCISYFKAASGALLTSLDNAPIGATTPAAGAFTSLTVGAEIVETVYALSGTTPALNPANGTIQTWTLTGNSSPTDSLASGESILLMVDDGSSRTITWPTMTWVNNAGAAPTLATSGYTVVVLWKVGSTLYGALVGDGS